MRSRIVIITLGIATLSLIICGCGKAPEQEVTKKVKKEPESRWPETSLSEVVMKFKLEEVHYHIRKAKHTAPGSYGSYNDMAIAMGYTKMAYNDNRTNDHAVKTADYLVREHDTQFDAPYGRVPRCKWCGAPMPRQIQYWPTDIRGEKVVECPNCDAVNSFPSGLVYKCPWDHDVKAGTHLSPHCDECRRTWKGTDRRCPACHADLNTMKRDTHRCPECGAVWNEDVPFADWPRKAVTRVDFTGDGTGRYCQGYTAVTGFPCPNRVEDEDAEAEETKCYVHDHQAQRDEAAEEGGGAPGGAAPSGAGGGPGGMGPGGPAGMGPGAPGGMPAGEGAGSSPPGAPPGA